MEWFFWIIVIGLAWFTWVEADPFTGTLILFWGIGIRLSIAFLRWILWGGRGYRLRTEAELKKSTLNVKLAAIEVKFWRVFLLFVVLIILIFALFPDSFRGLAT